MTGVDFYILDDLDREASLRFACRLSLRAFGAGSVVHLHARDADQARMLDELMWDYPRHRFLPHEQVTVGATPTSPIHIGCGEPLHQEGLLINLADAVPEFYGRFDRVAEIVVGQTREAGRERYRHYRHRGLPLRSHDMHDWEDAS